MKKINNLKQRISEEIKEGEYKDCLETNNTEYCDTEKAINDGSLVMGLSDPFDEWCDGLEDK